MAECRPRGSATSTCDGEECGDDTGGASPSLPLPLPLLLLSASPSTRASLLLPLSSTKSSNASTAPHSSNDRAHARGLSVSTQSVLTLPPPPLVLLRPPLLLPLLRPGTVSKAGRRKPIAACTTYSAGRPPP